MASTSIPTVKMFRHGIVIRALHGAESESALRGFINRHLSGESNAKYTAAIQSYHSGDLDKAVTQAAEATEAAMAEPDNPRMAVDLVKMLMLQQRYAQADDLINSLPITTRELPEVRNLGAHVNLIRDAQRAPSREVLENAILNNPNDLEARYSLSAVHLTQDDYTGSMKQLLKIVKCDSNFRQQAGQNGLLAIFTLLGEDDARAQHFRALLHKTIH